jgi:hypothetical protein
MERMQVPTPKGHVGGNNNAAVARAGAGAGASIAGNIGFLLKAGADDALEHVNCRAWQYSGLSTSSMHEQAELEVLQTIVQQQEGQTKEEVGLVDGADSLLSLQEQVGLMGGADSLLSLRHAVDGSNCSMSTINNSSTQNGTFCVNYSATDNGSGLLNVKGFNESQPNYIMKKRLQLLASPEKALRPPLHASEQADTATTSCAMGIDSAATSGVGGVGVGGVDKGATSVEAELDAWRVTIDSTETEEDRSGSSSGHGGGGVLFTVYLVTVSTAVDTWTVKKRFREFHKLHRLLSQDLRKSAKNPYGGTKSLGFPKRGLGLGGIGLGMGAQGTDGPELKLERLVQLGTYLQRVLSRRRELTDRKLLALFSFLCYGGVVARARTHAQVSLRMQQEVMQQQKEELMQQQQLLIESQQQQQQLKLQQQQQQRGVESPPALPRRPSAASGDQDDAEVDEAELLRMVERAVEIDEDDGAGETHTDEARTSSNVSTSIDAIVLESDLEAEKEAGTQADRDAGVGGVVVAEMKSVSCQTAVVEEEGVTASESVARKPTTRESTTSPISIPQGGTKADSDAEACGGSGSKGTGGSTLAEHLLDEAAAAMADVMVEAMIDVLSEVAADVTGRPTPEMLGFLAPSIEHFGHKRDTSTSFSAKRSHSTGDVRAEGFSRAELSISGMGTPASIGPSPAGSSMVGPSPNGAGWAMGAEELFRRRYWRGE